MGKNEKVLTVARRLTRFLNVALDQWELDEFEEDARRHGLSMTEANARDLRKRPADIIEYLDNLRDYLSGRELDEAERLIADVRVLMLEEARAEQ